MIRCQDFLKVNIILFHAFLVLLHMHVHTPKLTLLTRIQSETRNLGCIPSKILGTIFSLKCVSVIFFKLNLAPKSHLTQAEVNSSPRCNIQRQLG